MMPYSDDATADTRRDVAYWLNKPTVDPGHLQRALDWGWHMARERRDRHSTLTVAEWIAGEMKQRCLEKAARIQENGGTCDTN